jgi:hypothetical protein
LDLSYNNFSTPFPMRFFTVHNTTQQSYGRIISFSLWVKW